MYCRFCYRTFVIRLKCLKVLIRYRAWWGRRCAFRYPLLIRDRVFRLRGRRLRFRCPPVRLVRVPVCRRRPPLAGGIRRRLRLLTRVVCWVNSGRDRGLRRMMVFLPVGWSCRLVTRRVLLTRRFLVIVLVLLAVRSIWFLNVRVIPLLVFRRLTVNKLQCVCCHWS